MKSHEQVIREITAERDRQINEEGWSAEDDDEHYSGQLANAAACYALSAGGWGASTNVITRHWPWNWSWWKPTTPRRDLIKAAALIVAEIERMDRKTQP